MTHALENATYAGTIMRFLLLCAACALVACGDDSMPGPDAGRPDSGVIPTDADTSDAGPPPMCGSTIGVTCDGDPACNDTCFCNGVEVCTAGVCAAGPDPCDDGVGCTVETCSEVTVACDTVLDHGMCSDDDECNGRELCQPEGGGESGCVDAVDLECNDGSECTLDSCDPAVGCVFAIPDRDLDGYGDGICGGEDCNDDPVTGPTINPDADEDCGNGFDDDCDGVRDYRDVSCVPVNDACSSATVMAGPGRYSGAMRGLRSDYTLSCGGSGPDAVFRFEITTPRDVVVTVSGGGGGMFGGGGPMSVALRRFDECSSGPDERCFNAPSPVIHARSLEAGEYAIIVKGDAGSVYDVVLELSDPTPAPRTDVCNAMTEDATGGGLFTGFYDEVDDDYRLSCNDRGAARDAALRFTVAPGEMKDVTVTSSGAFRDSTFIALTTDCSSAAGTVACVQGFGPTTLRRRDLGPGTYFVLLETADTSAVMWSVRVTLSDSTTRLPGDACASAIGITGAPGSVDLAMMSPDGGNSCFSDSSAVDANFFFDVPAGGADVTVTTTMPFGRSNSASVSTRCGSFGGELQCRVDDSPIVQRWLSLAEGRYWVTGVSSGGAGMMTATANISTPPTPIPRNDRCAPPPATAGPIPLVSGVLTRGMMADYGDDIGTCVMGGPDAFYSIEVTTTSFVTITVSGAMGFTGNLGLSIGTSCGDPTSIACNIGRPAAFSEMLEPGTYLVTVESEDLTPTGEFSIITVVSPI
jgi:hypothetical protein